MADSYFLGGDISRRMEGVDPVTPVISTDLDSVRAYQWEVTFFLAGDETLDGKPLTLAAKQVNGIGMSLEDIEVNRVNDKVYYPGRPSMEELTVTFDNLQKKRVDKILYETMAKTYDPRTGQFHVSQMANKVAPSNRKIEIQVLQLDGDGTPRNLIRLFGCYAKALTFGEYNYSTNEFHTIEMKFRYDQFAVTYDKSGALNGTV